MGYETDLLALQVQINDLDSKLQSLETKKSILSSQKIISRNVKKEKEKKKYSGQKNIFESTSALNLVGQLNSLRTENLHRLTGITAFKVPYLGDDGLGIRFECYQLDHYTTPHYVILRRDFKTKKSFRIYKHTIPHYIPIHEFEKRYLISIQSLLLFVKKIRTALHVHYERLQLLPQLKKLSLKTIETDNAFSLWKLTLHDKRIITLISKPNNFIEKAMFYDKENGERPSSEPYLLGPLYTLPTRLSTWLQQQQQHHHQQTIESF